MMRISAVVRILAVSLLALTAGVAGCGSSKSTAPGLQPQIANLPDDFSYQVTSVSNHTGTWTYAWQNSGIAANVNQSTTVTAGTMQLELLDASGALVYSRSLADNGTFVSSNGTPGQWTLRVVYTRGSGTVNFRAQKKT